MSPELLPPVGIFIDVYGLDPDFLGSMLLRKFLSLGLTVLPLAYLSTYDLFDTLLLPE